ncbi:hypothetical protein DC31_06090 [Microbacterium sp. CH12i]|nr:hypothetical protein DC31_06090 [Microbacterium sp. CH12i]
MVYSANADVYIVTRNTRGEAAARPQSPISPDSADPYAAARRALGGCSASVGPDPNSSAPVPVSDLGEIDGARFAFGIFMELVQPGTPAIACVPAGEADDEQWQLVHTYGPPR